MRREFSINILFLVAINLLIKPFFIFGIDRTVQNVVGTSTYGVYFELLSLTYLFQIINDFGIQNFNNREIARHRQLVGKYFPNIIWLKCILAIIFLLILFLAAFLTGYSPDRYSMLLFLGFNQILVSFIFFLRSNISGLGHYRFDSFLSTADKLFMILICSLLLWWPVLSRHFTIIWFVYAQTVSLIFTALLAIVFLNGKIPTFRLRFRWGFVWLVIRKSYPFALVILLMTLYTRIDVVMIGRMLPDGDFHTGVYGAAYRLLDASNMIGFLFASLLLPMFSRLLKTGQGVSELVRHSFLLIWSGAVSLVFPVFFYRHEIMDLLYTQATPYFGEVMGLLMFSFIAVAGSYIFGTLLTANGSLMKMNRIFLFSIALNIGLNLVLIPLQQAKGAALATLVTQWFVFLAQLWLARRELGLSHRRGDLVRLLVFLSGSLGISFILHQSQIIPYWIPAFLISIGTCLVLSALVGMVELEWIRALRPGARKA